MDNTPDHIKHICSNLEAFSELVSILQEEYRHRIFRTTDLEQMVELKNKYNYLSELDTYIKNINSEENE